MAAKIATLVPGEDAPLAFVLLETGTQHWIGPAPGEAEQEFRDYVRDSIGRFAPHGGHGSAPPRHVSERRHVQARPDGQPDSFWGDDPATNPAAAARQKLLKHQEKYVAKRKKLEKEMLDADQQMWDAHKRLNRDFSPENRAAYQAAFNKHQEAQLAVRKHDGSYLRDARRQLYEPAANRSSAGPFDDSPVSGTAKRRIKRTVITESSVLADEFIDGMIPNYVVSAAGDRMPHGAQLRRPMILATTQIGGGGDTGRSWYSSGVGGEGGAIVLSPSNGMRSASTKVHEMGHSIERQWDTGEDSMRFVDKRATGPARSLRELAGNNAYNADEKAIEDKFKSHYTGKDYGGGGTEVLSMGMQHMYEDPAAFAIADPGHFDYTYNTLKGRHDLISEGLK